MEAEVSWYYLQHSRQVGPFTRSELDALLSKEVITADTLVWQRKRSWQPISRVPQAAKHLHGSKRRPRTFLLAAALFWGGLSYETKAPAPSTTGSFAPIVVTATSPAALHGSRDTGEVTRPVGPARDLPASSQLVQEYWRSIAYSKVIGRYEYYLRRSPSGSFAAAAAERIKELRSEVTPKLIKPKPKKVEARAKAVPSKATKPNQKKIPVAVTSKKADGRCWSRNIDQCRVRCQEGEQLACHKLIRLGG